MRSSLRRGVPLETIQGVRARTASHGLRVARVGAAAEHWRLGDAPAGPGIQGGGKISAESSGGLIVGENFALTTAPQCGRSVAPDYPTVGSTSSIRFHTPARNRSPSVHEIAAR